MGLRNARLLDAASRTRIFRPMNAHDPFLKAELAQLHYGDGEYVVLKAGKYVLCAVTGAKIPLDALRYWSPEAQEAYAGPEQALQRWQELNAKA